MIKSYYKVLGLTEEATEHEIKKAYFKLVRQYSPETDPEKFQEIREAYECLKDGRGDEQYKFSLPEDKLAEELYDTLEHAVKGGDYEWAFRICENALTFFPETIVFRYQLGICQRRAGKTGKAVKTCELLVSKEPDNRFFQRELALSYMERGFTKKAFLAFQKAYELGCRDEDFLLLFSVSCMNNQKLEEGYEVLMAMVADGKRRNKEDFEMLLEAYVGLYQIRDWRFGRVDKRLNELFLNCLSEYTSFLDDYGKEVLQLVGLLFLSISGSPGGEAVRMKAHECLKAAFHSEENKVLLKGFEERMDYIRLEEDKRLGKAVMLMYGACTADFGHEAMAKRYAIIEAQLCIIAELPDILGELEILEKDYPAFYERIRKNIEAIREGKSISYLKSKLLGEYRRMYKNMTGGYYFDWYPEEMREVQIYDPEEENYMPYVRDGKKIGRNDPCPCGSGKKYKNCCGR